MAEQQLTSNVYVIDEKTGQGIWYGPDYPDAGAPPEGAVTNSAAFAEPDPHPDLRFSADDFAGSGDDPRAVLFSDAPREATSTGDVDRSAGRPTRRR